ncbi:MAG: SDR family NAD(P)-dependent oxidoreductase, partial [Planctomycetaceae bacterium]
MSEPLRVLVTGGAGFIGSHIADLLAAAGHQVAVLDDLSSGSAENLASGTTFFQADIRDAARVREIMDEFQPTAVCHQAAHISVSRSVREPVLDAESNILGLLHILREGVRVGVRRISFAA